VVAVYVIAAVPALTPTTTPSDDPIVALAVVLLVHVPPADELVKVVEAPLQTVVLPPMAGGNALTVTAADAELS
jgi:hypothetical protein